MSLNVSWLNVAIQNCLNVSRLNRIAIAIFPLNLAGINHHSGGQCVIGKASTGFRILLRPICNNRSFHLGRMDHQRTDFQLLTRPSHLMRFSNVVWRRFKHLFNIHKSIVFFPILATVTRLNLQHVTKDLSA